MARVTDTFMRNVLCPVCQEEIGRQTALSEPGSRPHPGAFSLCYYCASPLRYETGPLGNLVLRLITEDEAAAFARSGGRTYQDVLRALIAGRARASG